MLAWPNLSRSSRVGAVFFLFVLLVGGPLWVLLATSIGEKIQACGGVVVCFGVLLNPQSFLQPASALISFENMPRICRILIVSGIVVLLGGLASKYLLLTS
jgi:hypothetical protein